MKEGIRQSGFSLIEMSLVMFIVSGLVIVSMPLLKVMTNDAKRKQGRDELSSVLNSLKGYAIANGAFPDFPNDGGGADIVYQLPTAKLGLKTKSEYQDIIYYDVNDALQFTDEAAETAGQTTAAFCTAVLAEIDKVVAAADPMPRICNDTTSCAPATVADQTSVALVLITRGRNTALENNNGDGDRVYESSDRGQDDTYDDVMKTMTLYEVSSYFGCSDDVSGSWGQNWSGSSGINCGANGDTVVIHNTGVLDLYVSQQNQVCWAVSPNNFTAFCNTTGWAPSIDVDISANNSCSAATTYTINNTTSDSSGDGDIRISCVDDYTACTVD